MKTILLKSTIMISIMVVLFACENSITVIQEITRQDTLAVVSAQNIRYERTDSGYIQVVLTSTLMNRYDGDNPYSEFPEGFEVTFYDAVGKEVSFLRADYGISYEKTKLMHARNKVVVKNFETQQELNTENLVWDQRKKTINSNTFVKITEPDNVIYGDSMRATESFSEREIFNFRGVFEVEEDTLTKDEE